MNTIYAKKWIRTDGYITKFVKQSTDLKKAVNLPMSNYKKYLQNEAIIHVHSLRAYTSMNPDQSHSPLSLTTGVKYVRKEDADHLEQTIKNSYPMKTDWTGEYHLRI